MCNFVIKSTGALTLTAILWPSASAPGQCNAWLAGPLDNGTAPNGTNDPGSPGSAPVQALTTWDPDGAGPSQPMLVAAGTFNSVQGVSANRIAARDPSTGAWRALGTGVSVGQALAVFNGELYAADNISRWDGTNWHFLGGLLYHTCCSPPPCNCLGIVNAMLVFNGELIAGGHFTTAGGQDAGHVARWNGSTWSPMGTNLNTDEFSTVNALTIYNGQLIAGGLFTLSGNDNVAFWDGLSWRPLSIGSGPTDFGEIFALTVFNGQLIVGGTIQLGQGAPVISIASWNGSTWQGLGTGVNHSVEALTVYNGALIAGGYFDNAGGQAANKVARWNGSTWSSLGSGVGSTNNEHVTCLTVQGNELIVGGRFTTAGGVSANNLAHWNGTTWHSFGGGTAASVNALTTLGSRVIIGGDFDQTCTNVSDRAVEIAAWNGTALEPLSTGMNNAVLALKSYPINANTTELVAGGHFNAAGNLGPGSANRIARWQEGPFSLPLWLPMGTGFNSAVFALDRVPGNQVLSDTTYAGGAFTASGDSTATFLHIAAWSGSPPAWTPVGTGLNNIVRAIKGFNTGSVTQQIIAGGDFTAAGSVAVNHIAMWPIFNLNGWQAMGAGFNNTVYAIERFNSVVYAAGAFTLSGPTPLNRIAKWNGSAWVAVGNGGASGGFNGTVYSLRIVGSNLYAGGDFTSVDGIATNRVAKFDGTSWSAVPGGADGAIFTLAPYQSELVAGGSFNTVGSPAQASARLGRFSESGVPWIVQQPNPVNIGCNENTTFSIVLAPGYPGLTYAWRKGGTPLANGPTGHGSSISGANTALLTISGAGGADTGSYDCLVTKASCGSVTSTEASLTLTNACCPADINHSGFVDVDDLLAVISSWGPCPAPPLACPADIAPAGGNGAVNVDDLLAVITGWGVCP